MTIPQERLPFLYTLCCLAAKLGGWRRVIEHYREEHHHPPDLSYLDLSEPGLRQMGFDPYDSELVRVLRNFAATDLRGACLAFAHIPNGDFRCVWLDHADCQEGNFSGSTFVQASLCHANMRGAQLVDVSWGGADKANMKKV